MLDTDYLVSELIKESHVDFVGLPVIVSLVHDESGFDDSREIRKSTLEIVRELMVRGVEPGDYNVGDAIFRFWRGTLGDHLERIRSEWTASVSKPEFDKPICWFALRPPDLTEKAFWMGGKWVES